MVAYPTLGIALVVTLYFHPRGQEALYYVQWQQANDDRGRATYFARLRRTKPSRTRMAKYWEVRAFELIPKTFDKKTGFGQHTRNGRIYDEKWPWGVLTIALRHGYAEAILPALIAAIKHKDTTIRVTAIRALRRLNGKATSTIPLLIGLLKDHDRQVSLTAAATLGFIGKNETVAAALPALRIIAKYDASWVYRSAAQKSIRQINEGVRKIKQKIKERMQQRKQAAMPKPTPISAPTATGGEDDPW